jgi:hypothetical protein
MSQITLKSFRLAFWIVLPFLFTSYISPLETKKGAVGVDGSYNLRASGYQPMALQGTVVFSAVKAVSSKGKPCSTIQLDLRHKGNGKVHSMGFLIRKQNWGEELEEGRYKVPAEIDGFIQGFEGVFGFANIKELGELPFFAVGGTIDISYIGPKLLHGDLEIKLRNSEGKYLNIKGDFNATRRILE